MFCSELHQRYTLERLQKLREQAELERHIPKFSLRRQLAGFLHRLALRLESGASEKELVVQNI